MKRIFSLLMVVIILASAYAYAENGKVLPNYITVRQGPGDSYNKICNAYNFNQLVVVGEVVGSNNETWLMLDVQNSNLNSDETIGYVKKVFVSTNGYWIQLNGSVYLYSDPWSGKRNGYRETGEILYVIYEDENWYVVQTNDEESGSSFIKKNDVRLVTDYYQPDYNEYYGEDNSGEIIEDPSVNTEDYGVYWLVISSYTDVYKDIGGEVIYTLYRGDQALMMRRDGEYGYFYFKTPAGTAIYGWISMYDVMMF